MNYDVIKSIAIMKSYGMTEPEPVEDTHEVEIEYAGFYGKMPYNIARQMMNEIWQVNPLAVFVVDGVFEKSQQSMLRGL